jgi:hypothetical protein
LTNANKPSSSRSNEYCGIVMPISSIDGCDENHWANVREILSDAIIEAGFHANLVSVADEAGVIQKRIIQNLYENPVVVCDVSGKNPNVMLELGIRLGFDKPVIIVKDDQTSYSFDTSPIEHIGYPRDLRYQSIVEFKRILSAKIKATALSASKKSHSTFLSHFGTFKVASINTEEVSADKFILSQLQDLKDDLRILTNRVSHGTNIAAPPRSGFRPPELRARQLAKRHIALSPADANFEDDKQIREVTARVIEELKSSYPHISPERAFETAFAAVIDVLHKNSMKERD